MIVLSRRGDARTALDAKAVAARKGGLAGVFIIEPQWTGDLTSRVGRRLAVFNGGVRVYLPGLRKDEDPQRHQLHFGGEGDPTAETRRRVWRRIRCFFVENSAEIYRSQGSPIPCSAVDSETAAFRRRPNMLPLRQPLLPERVGAQLRSGLVWAKRRITSAVRAPAGSGRISVATESDSLWSDLASVKRRLQVSERSGRNLSRRLTDEQRKCVELKCENNLLKESL